MASMHAVRIHSFGGPSVLQVEDINVPDPKDDEIVIKVHAASLNPVDYKIRSGGYLSEDKLPVVLGRDVAGVVSRVGNRISKFQNGDAVYAMLGRDHGGYAEYAIATENEAAPKPSKLDFVTAAAVPLAALTAWQGLFDKGGLKAGQRALIHGGAGGVGHFAIQFAKAKGAWVATTVSADDLSLVRELGADEAIDYKAQRFEDVVNSIDLVFDLIGGDTQNRSFAVLKDGGTLVSTLMPPDKKQAQARNIRALNYMAQPNAEQLSEIGRLIESGEVMPVVQSTYPLEAVAKAQAHMENDHVQGKVVLEVAA